MHKTTLILSLVATSVAFGSIASPTFAARQKPTPEQRTEWMMKRLDTNGDKKVSLEEIQGKTADAFKAFDTDSNGQVTREEIKSKRDAFQEARKEIRAAKNQTGADKQATMEKIDALRPAMLPGMRPKAFDRVDTDKNGTLSLAEVSAQTDRMFKRRDRNSDGFIDAADFSKKG